MTLPPIVARVTAETSGLTRGLSSAETRLATFAKVGGAAAGAVGAAIIALTAASMKNIDALTKQARSLGLTTAAFQKMTLVAREAGVEQGQLAQMLGLMQRATDRGSDALGRLGISLSDIQGLSPDEQFERIAVALDRVKDPAEKTNLAMELFGRSGRAAINMLSDYSEKVRDAAAFQERFGIAVSQAGAKQVERANDAVGRLRGVMSGLGNTLAVAVSPAVEAMANFLINATAAMLGLRTEAEEYDRQMKKAFEGVGMNVSEVVFGLERMRDALIVAGNDGAGQGIQAIIDALMTAQAELDAGAISATEFGERIAETRAKAEELIASLDSADKSQFTNVIARLGQLWGALDLAAQKARELRAAMPGAAEWEMAPSDGSSVTGWESDPNAPRTRPQRPGVDAPFSPVGTGGGGGGGGGVRDDLAARLEALMEGLQTEAEVVAEWYAQSQATLEEALARKMLTEEEYRAQRERLEQEHQERIANIREMGNQWGVSAVLEGGQEILNAMGQTNKKALRMAKVFGAARALVDTMTGAAAELKKGVFGFASAAAVIAKGMGFVAAIRGVNEGGGGAMSAGGGGSASAAPLPIQRVDVSYSGPEAFRPTIAGLIAQLGQAAQQGYRIDPRLVAG